MRKLSSALCAVAVAASFAISAVVPVNAAPLVPPRVAPESNGVVNVQSRMVIEDWQQPRANRQFRRDRREFRQDRRQIRRALRQDRRQFRQARRDFRRGAYWNNGGYYYNGYRGYRNWRRGYHEHNGWWFPAGAFIAGAIIGNAINSPAPVYRDYSSAHVQWCYNRYRSYREYDNTFQPYHGPRQQCYSPYS